MKTATTFHAINGANILTDATMESATITNLIITEIVVKGFANVIRNDIKVAQTQEGAASERVISVYGTRNGAAADLTLGLIDCATGIVKLDDHVEYIAGALEFVTA